MHKLNRSWAIHAGLFAASIAVFALFYRFQQKINEWGNESKAYLLKQIKLFGGYCKVEPGSNAVSDSNAVELQRLNELTTQGDATGRVMP